MHFDRRSIPAELGDIIQWPRADESALSEQARSQLGRRVQAMTLFVDGHTPLREITRQTGVGFNDLYRMTLHLLGRACVDSFLSFLAEADQLRGPRRMLWLPFPVHDFPRRQVVAHGGDRRGEPICFRVSSLDSADTDSRLSRDYGGESHRLVHLECLRRNIAPVTPPPFGLAAFGPVELPTSLPKDAYAVHVGNRRDLRVELNVSLSSPEP
ncbi:hypothetical protein WJ73_27345 [Burkholderia ubonensis]|nr:hypothetical protein WJ73_27345 [Burkholderia ubonensis]